MTKYSQNNEQDYILEYFKEQPFGIFLEIGAFDPFVFSNTRCLVETNLWKGYYVEPSMSCYMKFINEYVNKESKYLGKIEVLNYAIGSENKIVDFYDSMGDAVSTTNIQHKEKWETGYGSVFEKTKVQMITFDKLFYMGVHDKIDFLNLDVESTNIELLNLIPDWFWVDLKMLCIEHDNQQDYIIGKLQPFGFKELHRNGENLIIAK